MMSIPLVDLRIQYRDLASEVSAAMARVLDQSDFILGQEVTTFEREFADYCGVQHAVGCANGTDALELSCRALDIGPGDEVIIPAMTFVATALGPHLAGAKPILVDVLPDSALIDPARVEAAITPRTRAIIPVHLYGQCCDMEIIGAVARRNGLRIIEDAAQAHGAVIGERRAGALGDVAAFSFYPGKNLGAYGDGGCVVTNDFDIAQKVRLLRNWGSQKKYHHEIMGKNSRLDTLQAAILRVKLGRLNDWNAARRRHASRYDEVLASSPGVTLTRYSDGCVYHLYVIRVEHRDRTLATLNAEGIGAGIHYPFAVHELGATKHLGFRAGDFPVAEAWARHCLSLPLYPELPSEVPARVADALRKVEQ
jgi:dTDP-4-amino-4,6-dideoxygalactose transaminase